MSDSSNSFFDSNAKWIDERRSGSLGLPDFSEDSNLLDTFKSDAAALSEAVDTWWDVAVWGVELVRDCHIIDLPRGFTRLTDGLILFCDTVQMNIDAAPLRELHDVLYAREGELYDLVSKTCWRRTPEEIEAILHKAMIVKDRIKDVASTHSKKSPDSAPVTQKSTDSFSQRVEWVREILEKHPKATQAVIQGELKKSRGQGMRRSILKDVLDVLREKGEYPILPRKRSAKGK